MSRLTFWRFGGLPAALTLALGALAGCTPTAEQATPASTTDATPRPSVENATPEKESDPAGQKKDPQSQAPPKTESRNVTPGDPHFALEILLGAPGAIENHPTLPSGGTAESYVSSTTPFKVESVLDSSGPRTFHFYCTEEAAQFTFTTQTSDLVRSGPCSANRVVSFTLPASAYRDGKLVLNIDSSIAGTPVEVLTERKNQ